MYVPRHFAEDDSDVVLGLVRSTGFGHLVVAASDGLSSTPLPFVVDDALRSVRAHLARPNPIWRAAPCDALLIVPITDAYVTPSWYAAKAVDGKVVPTWNYEVVHVRGRLLPHDDPDWVLRQMHELTDHNESPLAAPWSVADAPADYIDALRRGTVGLELEVVEVTGKRKLSQNRPEQDIARVRDGLAGCGDRRSSAVAEAMGR